MKKIIKLIFVCVFATTLCTHIHTKECGKDGVNCTHVHEEIQPRDNIPGNPPIK